VGTWGTGIFSDDTAADVRGEWREALMDGLADDEATARVLAQFADVLDDPDDGVIVWLALAAAQMQTGRLQEDVRDRALSLIAAGGDVDRWREASERSARQRAKVLQSLAEKLRGPQRTPTTLRRPRPTLSPLDVGDVVRIRGTEGGAGLFVVVDHSEAYPPGSTEPVVAALLWDGREVPDDPELGRLPLIRDADAPRSQQLHRVFCPARGRNALANFGEVVAQGVLRPDAADYRRDQSRGFRDGPSVGHCTWSFLAGWIDGPWYRRCVEATRRVSRG
jgi:hypothetical protein